MRQGFLRISQGPPGRSANEERALLTDLLRRALDNEQRNSVQVAQLPFAMLPRWETERLIALSGSKGANTGYEDEKGNGTKTRHRSGPPARSGAWLAKSLVLPQTKSASTPQDLHRLEALAQ